MLLIPEIRVNRFIDDTETCHCVFSLFTFFLFRELLFFSQNTLPPRSALTTPLYSSFGFFFFFAGFILFNVVFPPSPHVCPRYGGWVGVARRPAGSRQRNIHVVEIDDEMAAPHPDLPPIETNFDELPPPWPGNQNEFTDKRRYNKYEVKFEQRFFKR